MSATTATGGDAVVLVAMTHKEDDINNIADETHNYSYCSDHSISSPMCITPKPSTRTLIDYWSNPHESGMTMSFSQYEKSSTGSSSINKTSGSVQSLSYSPETSMRSIPLHMKTLLDVTCDVEDEDEDRNEVTETTESSTENQEELNESHQYSSTSNYENGDDLDGIKTVEDHNNKEEHCPTLEFTAPTSMIKHDSEQDNHNPTSTLIIPITAANDDDTKNNSSLDAPSQQCYSDMSSTLRVVAHDATTKRSVTPLLPPLPPTARRTNRKIVEGNVSAITREQYIAKAIESRSLPPTQSSVIPPKVSSLPYVPSPTDMSLATMTDIPPATVSPVPFVDTSLSTIHDEIEQSFDGKLENELAKPEKSLSQPFSPEREVMLSDDDVLDLTSIHSEDSNGEILCNTRHHVVDVPENHHSLIHDVYISNNDIEGHDVSAYDDDLANIEQNDTPLSSNHSLIKVTCGVVSPALTVSSNVETTKVAIIEEVDESDIKDDVNVGDSREHNRSNDTEHMLANVIDAAEKSILKGQEEQMVLVPHQMEPSMFFDCEEYDASTQIRANDSALPLKFLTLNDPLSPLATIHDFEIYQSSNTTNCDAQTALSPVSHPSEHLFTRVTPLRSNSSRIEDISKVNGTIDNITVPPLKKKAPRKKLLPRKDGAEHLPGRNKKVYRKREKLSSAVRVAEDLDDDELSSSVSTLEMDDEKDESTDLFWIDAFLDFVSPPEDSRSIDSDSSTSTGTGTVSNGATIRNVDANEGNTISTPTEYESSQKQIRNKKKPPTSLSRLREWWQKELIEEVMKGSLVKPLRDSENDSVDLRGSNDTVEKIVSKEFHKVLRGKKVSLLGSKKSPKEENETPNKNMDPTDWLEVLKSTIEAAASASLGCGTSESAVADEQVQVYDTTIATSPKSFDSLDDLVRELKNTKIETDPAVLREHFQSMYNQLQQKFKDTHLFDPSTPSETTTAPEEESTPPNTNISTNREMNSDDGQSVEVLPDEPAVEVLPDDSLQFLLHSNSQLYSPPTTDYLQQSDDIPNQRSGKSKTRVAKALAQAKAAIAQRRRAALKINSGAVLKADTEATETLQTIKEDPDLSVALADLDISMEESTADDFTTSHNFSTLDAEDDVRVTFNDPSSFISELNTTDSCSIDHSISKIVGSSSFDKDVTGTISIQNEEHPEASLFFENVNEKFLQESSKYSNEFLKDGIDKRNVTKETVTDNSGSEDSINIASELDQLIISRIQTHCTGADTSVWQSMEPHTEVTTMSENLSSNESHVSCNGEYHPLDSSGEKQWNELSMSGPSDSSADQASFVKGVQFADKSNQGRLPRTSTLKLRSVRSRSSNLKMMTLLDSDDGSVPKQRLGFKSKAFRKAQSYVAMQTVDHNSSMSTSKSASTCNSDTPVLNGKSFAPRKGRPSTDVQCTKKSKLVRNASLLSIIRKKSKKEWSGDDVGDFLKSTLINATERGSDDDTSPHGNDFDWEEFPSNTFSTSHSTKAAI